MSTEKQTTVRSCCTARLCPRVQQSYAPTRSLRLELCSLVAMLLRINLLRTSTRCLQSLSSARAHHASTLQVKKGLFSDEVKQTEVQTGPGAAIKQGLSNAAESISNAFSGGSSATGATTGASTGSAAPASGSTSTYKETKTTASKF